MIALPTEKTLEQKERLAECSDFFQGSMQEHFEKFVHYQKQVEQEQTFVTQCLTLLDVQVPAVTTMRSAPVHRTSVRH